MVHRGLHGFGRLQHLGHDQLVGVEQPAHFRHARHQRPIDDVERSRAFLALQIEIGDQAFLGAFDDVIGQALIERKVGRFHFLRLRAAAEKFGDLRDVVLIDRGLLLGRLLAPVLRRRDLGRRRVEQQTLGQMPLLFRNRSEAFQLFRIDDRQIEPGLRAVIKEDGIDHFARRSRQSERDIGNAQRRLHIRNILLDQPQRFDGLDRAADVIGVARSRRETPADR